MAGRTISQFYSDDHARLDCLFEKFQKVKENEPERATQILEEFKAGLEQHMAWEEAILFSEYDARVPSAEDESPTLDLNSDHQQIRECLEVVLRKMRAKDTNTDQDESRMLQILTAHNRSEEVGVYQKLDEILTDQDRANIRQRMEDSAF